MSTPSRLLRANSRLSPHLRPLYHRSITQLQAHRYESPFARLNSGSVRHMGIFRDFSERLKGEFKNNAELMQSVEQFKEKTVHFRDRTKVASDRIRSQLNVVEANARQVSTILREKVQNAKERVSQTSAKAKESISSFKVRSSEGSYFSSDGSKGTCNARRSEASGDRQALRGSAERLSKGFQTLSFSASAFLSRVIGAKVVDMVKKCFNLLIKELAVTASKRQIKASYPAGTTTTRSTSTALVRAVKNQTRWEKQWDNLKDKVQAHPLYKRIRGIREHRIVTKSQEIAEDVRERWETSDSPVVHKIQDLNDSIFGETATAVAVKEIRQRDPLFSFPDFLVEVQESTRPVLQAYLKGDLKELQKRCSREVVDRCRAERKAYESQGIFMDSKLLHISDVEVKETKLLGNTPIIIVVFQTQQIYCVRDKHGKITQGAKDDIHTVFYAWAMQQVVPDDYQDGVLYPYWQLREMQQLGIQSII